MAIDWSALNRYGRRDYKFVQSDSFKEVKERFTYMRNGVRMGLNNGVCMGVTMSWIKEKLTTSNSLLRSDGLLRSSATRRFSSSINPLNRIKQGISPPSMNRILDKYTGKGKSGKRNEGAMWNGALNQQHYQQRGVRELSIHLGLIENSSYQPTPKNSRDAHNLPERLHAETIADAASDLPHGSAILIEVTQPAGSGHAVAFYRSRGSTLYFFDSNTGVYTISESPGSNVLGFVNAWMGVYQTQRSITWETPRSDWFHVFDRARPLSSEF